MARNIKLHEIGIEWLHKRVKKKQFLIISSILVGLTAGLAAVLLKLLVHYIKLAITSDYHIRYQYIFYLLFPTIGILLAVVFTKRFLGGDLGRGAAFILNAIAKKNSRLPKHQMYSHVVTSALTVGFGGSAGLESPIVTTGSAIGSNYGDTYHLTYKDRTLLLACGAAAGIGAAFNAPIAGLLFSLEVLIADATVSAFIPIMIAAATGTLVSKIILDENILLSFNLRQPFNYHYIPWYIVLGVLAGFVSVYYSRTFPKLEGYFSHKISSTWKRIALGGAVLALLIWMFPSLYGEGYASIKTLADLHPELLMKNSLFENWSDSPWIVLCFIGAIMLVKVVATAVTLGSGGNGGNFAPSLFVGAYLGFFFAKAFNMFGIADLPVANFTIVAMSGILAGIFHAPLTGIFLIAEITGGYELMIPLMIVSAFSYSVVKYFEPFSMDTKRMAKKGEIFTHDRDKNALSSLSVQDILETNFQPIRPEMKLAELVDIIAHSQRNIFPVIDKEQQLLGIVLLDDIRENMFKTELYDTVTVRQLMHQPPAVISPDEAMFSVMQKFDSTNTWNLPVIDNERYTGFVSKSGVLTRYRKMLIDTTIDHE
ncbi:MAG TPA: chloride channel protein [Bacteroidia bacterium]|nr:chloride channel protein [Bacteroidia bacterium]